MSPPLELVRVTALARVTGLLKSIMEVRAVPTVVMLAEIWTLEAPVWVNPPAVRFWKPLIVRVPELVMFSPVAVVAGSVTLFAETIVSCPI